MMFCVLFGVKVGLGIARLRVLGRFVRPMAPLSLVFLLLHLLSLWGGVPVGATGACAVGAGCLAMG